MRLASVPIRSSCRSSSWVCPRSLLRGFLRLPQEQYAICCSAALLPRSQGHARRCDTRVRRNRRLVHHHRSRLASMSRLASFLGGVRTALRVAVRPTLRDVRIPSSRFLLRGLFALTPSDVGYLS